MNKGYVIVAQNTEQTDYVKCAEILAKSIKRCMPDAKVALINDNKIKSKVFDQVIKLPYGDLDPTGNWKLVNDWQVYEASPFEYTIKLEADMFIPSSIDHWWDVLAQRDVVVSTTIRNFRQEVSHERFYRRFIDDNGLPDCYNSITYFRKSELAERFFKTVRNIFENWEEHKAILKCKSDEIVTTDWAYAIACHILGRENTTLPHFEEMSMVHMKQWINGLPCEDWTKIFLYEMLPHTLRVQTFPQKYPFHYYIKNFSDKLEVAYK
jgi:hypothetical protein